MRYISTTMDSLPPLPPVVRICRIVLLVAFVAQIVMGHAVAFGLDSPAFAWHQDRVAEALWGDAGYGEQVARYRGWIQALLGGTMISYAWAMVFIVAVPVRRREPWAGWAIAAATLNWFVVDTGVSLAHGVGVNVAFNCVALASTLIPLALIWPWLRKGAQTRSKIRGQ